MDSKVLYSDDLPFYCVVTKYRFFPEDKGVGLKAKCFKVKYEALVFSDRDFLVGGGEEVQTRKCHCFRDMDIFWNNTFYQSVLFRVRLSAADYVSITGPLCI